MLENFGIKDIIDIVLVALIMYQLYYLVKKTGRTTIFKGILAFLIVWIFVSKVFEMRLLGVILDTFVNVGIFILIVLFQDEIRRFLTSLGSNKTLKSVLRFLGLKNDKSMSYIDVAPIVVACMNMAKTKTGALIVIEQEIQLNVYAQTGETINTDINTRLIENIFFKNSPLHDGAMIIADGRIKAAGCILPISQNQDIPKQLGLRHRAALGITQETDAKVIIVSEERGKISFAIKGRLELNITPERLQVLLTGAITRQTKRQTKKGLL